MKHRNHMIPCAIVAVVAIVVFSVSGSAPLGAGIGLTLLLCPLVMGTVMWLLMRQSNGSATHDDRSPAEPVDQPQHAAGGRRP